MKRRKFIKITGASGIALAGLSPLISLSCSKSGINRALKDQALLAFKRFENVWDFPDFWKRGNTFDACLVFANAVRKQWAKDSRVEAMNSKIVEMLVQNLAFFKSVDIETMWADDFGWWGLMGLNARTFLLAQGEVALADQYWNLSDELCWKYKKEVAYDHTKTALPIPHGCRNGDAGGNSLGVKNTVTNVLLFLLSSRIYRAAKAENREDTDKYLEMVYQQWVWFTNWFKLEEYEFLKKLSTKGALVQERPMAMVEGSGYTNKIHPPWKEGWVWTGDQGMLVAALSDVIAIKEDLAVYIKKNNLNPDFDIVDFEKEAKSYIRLIGKGVENALVGEVDGIIREAPCQCSFGPEHARDYVAGRGIMVRYLGSKEEKSKLGVNINGAIFKTLDAIWCTRDVAKNQFQPEFTSVKHDKLYVEQFRKLWGLADDVYKWDIDNMPEKNKNAVCQAVGLDILGAAIKAL
ncbi:hypothetical protein [Flavivirga eckloniae]|uniref:Glycosyl hydrolase family 76 n=1 Tax=Flavivirga eckloniae TaxID=1803846 RepID=A0A2K9PR60_9FLAO|nr:hypothetical protein [Flavivirga eckloniae]AUP79526.1 hypothetical protein C1H87_12735 [Flavivirga eckloniae]